MNATFIIICAGVLAIAVSAIVTRNRTALAIIGVLLLLVIGGLLLTGSHTANAPPQPVHQYGFAPTADMLDQASIYPTLRAATEHLANRLTHSIISATPISELSSTPQRLTANRRPVVVGNAPDDAKLAVASALSRCVPQADALRVSLDVVPDGKQSTLRVNVAGAVSLEAQAAFCDLAWADQGAPRQGARNDQSYVVGWSSDACVSENEAIEKSQTAAVNQLIARLYRRHDDLHGMYAGNVQLLIDRIKARVHDGRLPAECFIQSFKRNYGTIWRAAARLNATPATLDSVALDVRERHYQAASHQRAGILTVSLMSGVVVGVHLLMDLLTKGYFARPLRVVAVGALIVGAVVLILLT